MSDKRYDTYGWKTLTLDLAISPVATALGAELQMRESGYYGGRYYKYRLDSGRDAKLFSNYDFRRSEWIRRRYSEYTLIFEVADLPTMDLLQARLIEAFPGIVLLESQVIEGADEAEN